MTNKQHDMQAQRKRSVRGFLLIAAAQAVTALTLLIMAMAGWSGHLRDAGMPAPWRQVLGAALAAFQVCLYAWLIYRLFVRAIALYHLTGAVGQAGEAPTPGSDPPVSVRRPKYDPYREGGA